ncbi:hypothetical protein [Pseudobdellovibrio sp. HCB154]|uniref:hypothetical protein n=1 Tax=Pseudobdellovibrio sp. HCB154 TaxID=3386277 RepID=UPI003916D51A
MKSVLVLLIALSSAQAFACKMTPMGATARAIKAIVDFALTNEAPDSSIRAVYDGERNYVYEIQKQTKCVAVPVKVEVGPDCSHTVVKLADKISCRLN